MGNMQTLNPTSLDDLGMDFGMMDLPRPTGKLVRQVARYAVRRLTRRGMITVCKASTREQAMAVALPGDVVEEVQS